MARGFESKSVADQQEAAQAIPRDPAPEEADPLLRARRRRLELARDDIVGKMQSASAEGHREMLRRALEALEKELAALA